MYVVLKDFKDLKDNNYIYHKGDKYPRKGKVKKQRIEELSTTKNKRKEILIKKVDD